MRNISISEEDLCSKPYVFNKNGGRLGNQICALFSLYLLQKEFGFKVNI